MNPSQNSHQGQSSHGPAHYRETANQNFIEVRFSKNNIRDISKEEALLRYKRNAYIIGRIFTYPFEEEAEDGDEISDAKMPRLTDENVKTLRDEIDSLKKRHEQRLDELKQRNQLFVEMMNEYKHEMRIIDRVKDIKSQEEINDMIAKLKKENFYSYEYPFFCESSPFYLQTDDQFIRQVPEEQKQPSWTDSDNLHVYQL